VKERFQNNLGNSSVCEVDYGRMFVKPGISARKPQLKFQIVPFDKLFAVGRLSILEIYPITVDVE